VVVTASLQSEEGCPQIAPIFANEKTEDAPGKTRDLVRRRTEIRVRTAQKLRGMIDFKTF
jgi:hypothetical protein